MAKDDFFKTLTILEKSILRTDSRNYDILTPGGVTGLELGYLEHDRL